jgi:hypothetical protein
MVKEFHRVAPEDRKSEFLGYSRYGGASEDHDHRTKKGLFDTVSETLDDLPGKLWSHPEVDPENPYLQRLSTVKPPGAKLSFASTIEEKYVKPNLMPPFKTSWLSGRQIELAVHAATRQHTSFYFAGVHVPVLADTKNVIKQIKAVWHKKRRKSLYYKSYGVVWNTDAQGSGNHWVAAIFRPQNNEYEYFDSFGRAPSGAVKTQINRVTQALSSQPWTEIFTGTKHQKGGHQCGVYVLWYFLERIVKKRSYASLQSRVTPDADMVKLRTEHFIKADPKLIQIEQNPQHQQQVVYNDRDHPIVLDDEELEKKYSDEVINVASRPRSRSQLNSRNSIKESRKRSFSRSRSKSVASSVSSRSRIAESLSRPPKSLSRHQKSPFKPPIKSVVPSRNFTARNFRRITSLDNEKLVYVEQVWNELVNEATHYLLNVDSQLKTSIVIVMIWLKKLFLTLFCARTVEMPMLTVAHFIRCVISLIAKYIQRALPRPEKEQYSANIRVIGTAAVMLTFKVFGLDDSTNCALGVKLKDVVTFINKRNREEKLPEITKDELIETEIKMFAISRHTPCLEEFEGAKRRFLKM